MASSEPPPAPVPVPAPAAAPVAAPVQELIYPYIKLRKDFGRQPRFVEDDFRQNIDIKPNKNLRKRFRRIRFIEKSTQSCQQIAVSPVSVFISYTLVRIWYWVLTISLILFHR